MTTRTQLEPALPENSVGRPFPLLSWQYRQVRRVVRRSPAGPCPCPVGSRCVHLNCLLVVRLIGTRDLETERASPNLLEAIIDADGFPRPGTRPGPSWCPIGERKPTGKEGTVAEFFLH
jgi:hypothetical protein